MLKKSKTSTKHPDAETTAEHLISRLYDDIFQGHCVVFVGAGSTTERHYWRTEPSFYQEIKTKANFPPTDPPPSFPDLMEYFCNQMDGGRHNRLIREAVARIERFAVPGEDHNLATMFGDALAEIPYFNRFVTTNWDPFLERSLEVMIPTVEDRDLAFWDDRKRQVLKIHGCITRPYSIVATTTDYERCIRGNPLIFNKLKDLMATKTFLFVGYSLRDSDFQLIWDGIVKSLGRFTKLAYAIDPNASPDSVLYWKSRGIELFETTDIMFVRQLRSRLEKGNLIPAESLLEFLRRERERIANIHMRVNQHSSGGMASAMYQDGLIHALSNILTSTALGAKQIETFESDLAEARKILAKMHRRKDPIEISYWTGRAELLRRFLSRSKQKIPPFIHPFRFKPSQKFIRGGSF
jgi:SIR2-like domain